jgi:hypothetical protein
LTVGLAPSRLTRPACPWPALPRQVPLVPLDSCAISVADLKGGWANEVRISANGVGTWNNGRRPNFSVKTTDTCGFFDTSFPDTRVFLGALSQDKNLLMFSPDHYWARTSA